MGFVSDIAAGNVALVCGPGDRTSAFCVMRLH